MPWLPLLATSVYMLGWVGFAILYIREERTHKAFLVACVAVAVALLVTIRLGGLAGWVITIVATFQLAYRKNRSRGWALLAIALGPIALFILVLLPRKAVMTTLSLTT